MLVPWTTHVKGLYVQTKFLPSPGQLDVSFGTLCYLDIRWTLTHWVPDLNSQIQRKWLSKSKHTRKRKALLMATFTKRCFSQFPYKLCILHSRKWPAPVTNTFFTSWGCLLTRASTVVQDLNVFPVSYGSENPHNYNLYTKGYFHQDF